MKTMRPEGERYNPDPKPEPQDRSGRRETP
jgi:hypothetical protein